MSPHTPTRHRHVSLIGAPTDVGASCIGARMGPGALRVAGLADALLRCGLGVQDLGDLQGPDNPCQPAIDGWRHLSEVSAWNELVHKVVHGELASGQLVQVLPHIRFDRTSAQLTAVYPGRRLLSPRVRVFLEFLAGVCSTGG